MHMSHSLILRPLIESDHSQWLPQWLAYQEFYQMSLEQQVNAHTWMQLLAPNTSMYGAVACQGDQILGFVHYVFHASTWAENAYCYLEDLFVIPEARGQQVAKGLIEYVQQQAQEQNCARLYWHTQVTNHTAQRLYNWVAQDAKTLQYRMSLD